VPGPGQPGAPAPVPGTFGSLATDAHALGQFTLTHDVHFLA